MDSLYDAYETDEAKEKDGAWVTFPGGARLKLACAGGANVSFQKALDAKMKPVRREFALGLLDDKTSNRLHAEVYAETIVKDWEGVKDRKGNLTPFSREAVVALFTELPRFFAVVRMEADRIANFQSGDRETDQGN